MKLPRDLSGADLEIALKVLGYERTRKTGSHIRLTTQLRGEHHVTVPDHKVLPLGTLRSILRDVAPTTNSRLDCSDRGDGSGLNGRIFSQYNVRRTMATGSLVSIHE